VPPLSLYALTFLLRPVRHFERLDLTQDRCPSRPTARLWPSRRLTKKGITNLWVRPLDAAQATMLQGTEDATYPFWSPDSKYLGFVADHKLKKIAVRGGEAQTLADHVFGRGEWGANGTILFVDDHLSASSKSVPREEKSPRR